MQVILSGSLRHFPPGALLSFLASRSLGGTCDFESGGKRTRLFVDGDNVLWAESARGGDVMDTILEIFEWPAGTFTVLDTAALPENVKPVNLALSTILEEAKKRAESGSAYKDATILRVVDNPLQQQVSLNSDDLKLLFRLTADKPFADLVNELGMPRKELVEKLQRLEGLGLIRRENPVEQTMVAKKTDPALKRKRTLVGSLTPDGALDSVFPLLDAEQTIGRLPANGITLADGSVSSTHARITRTSEGFFIEDLQSRNGTFVNGEKIDSKRLLTDGDLVRLGKVILTFNVAKEGKNADTTQPEFRVV